MPEGASGDGGAQATAAELKRQGNALMKKCDYKGAVDKYSAGIGACEDAKLLAHLLGNRAHAYRQLKQYPAALADAERAIREASWYPKGYTRRVYILRDMGKWEACLVAIQEALASGLDFGATRKALDGVRANCKRRLLEREVVGRLTGGPNKGLWNCKTEEELGGGSQEMYFRSATEAVLILPHDQIVYQMRLDVTQSPMRMDLTHSDMPTALRHIFRFTSDGKALEMQGPDSPPGFDPTSSVVLPAPKAFNIKSKMYSRLSPGPAPESPEEARVRGEVERLVASGASDEAKMIRCCALMVEPLREAAGQGFKFQDTDDSTPMDTWTAEKKSLVARSVRISNYLFLLEKHFTPRLWNAIVSILTQQPGSEAAPPPVRRAVADLRKWMLAVDMDIGPEATVGPDEAVPSPPEVPARGGSDPIGNHQFSEQKLAGPAPDQKIQIKAEARGEVEKSTGGISSRVLRWGAAAVAVATSVGLAYYFWPSGEQKRSSRGGGGRANG